MSPLATALQPGRARFPRVSGDEPKRDIVDITREQFSPRERG